MASKQVIDKSFEFEREVRDFARRLWRIEPGSGHAVIIDNRERDGVFVCDGITNYIEITASTRLDPIKEQCHENGSISAKRDRKGETRQTLDNHTARTDGGPILMCER